MSCQGLWKGKHRIWLLDEARGLACGQPWFMVAAAGSLFQADRSPTSHCVRSSYWPYCFHSTCASSQGLVNIWPGDPIVHAGPPSAVTECESCITKLINHETVFFTCHKGLRGLIKKSTCFHSLFRLFPLRFSDNLYYLLLDISEGAKAGQSMRHTFIILRAEL